MRDPELDRQLKEEMARAQGGPEIDRALMAWITRSVESDRQSETGENDTKQKEN